MPPFRRDDCPLKKKTEKDDHPSGRRLSTAFKEKSYLSWDATIVLETHKIIDSQIVERKKKISTACLWWDRWACWWRDNGSSPEYSFFNLSWLLYIFSSKLFLKPAFKIFRLNFKTLYQLYILLLGWPPCEDSGCMEAIRATPTDWSSSFPFPLFLNIEDWC